jgi:RNA polymerase sigma factor (sigma-70 family)
VTGAHGQHGMASDLAARFTLEVDPFLAPLMRRCRRLTNSHADAEDLLQEVLLHAYKGFHTFSEGTNLGGWLFRILHNRWVNGIRRSQRRPTEVPAELMSGWDVAPYGINASAESEALSRLTDSALKEALASLPQGVQEVLYYATVRGYTYAETAEIMNIPAGTVMSRAARGREKMRELLVSCDTHRIT